MSLNPRNNLENKVTNNEILYFFIQKNKTRKCLKANRVDGILSIRYVLVSFGA